MKMTNDDFKYKFLHESQMEYDSYVRAFNFDNIDCYVSSVSFQFFMQRLERGEILNKEGEALNRTTILPYIKEYTISFNNGYKDFDNNIKMNETLLALPNDLLIQRIISKIDYYFIPELRELRTDEENRNWHAFSMGINGYFRDMQTPYNYISLDYMNKCGYQNGLTYKALELSTRVGYKDLISDEFTKLVSAGSEPKQTKPKKQTVYKFETIFPDSVPDLFTELDKLKLITTTKEHFLWAFGVEPNKPADFKPIIWHGTNALLSYMLMSCCTNKNRWKVGEYIFGKPNLGQDYNLCKGDPKDKNIIDDIISEIG